jgi:hypothetical protein
MTSTASKVITTRHAIQIMKRKINTLTGSTRRDNNCCPMGRADRQHQWWDQRSSLNLTAAFLVCHVSHHSSWCGQRVKKINYACTRNSKVRYLLLESMPIDLNKIRQQNDLKGLSRTFDPRLDWKNLHSRSVLYPSTTTYVLYYCTLLVEYSSTRSTIQLQFIRRSINHLLLILSPAGDYSMWINMFDLYEYVNNLYEAVQAE